MRQDGKFLLVLFEVNYIVLLALVKCLTQFNFIFI
jgi:hypothetical protein